MDSGVDAEENPGLRWAVLGMTAVAVDGLLLTVHRLHSLTARFGPENTWPLPFDSSSGWTGSGDGSLIEFWGQVQLLAAAVLLILLSRRSQGRRVLAAWGVVLIAAAVDDRFRLHERAGRLLDLEAAVPALAGWAAQEVGGLVYWAGVGAVLGAGLLGTYATSTPAARRASLTLLGAALPLVVVAVVYVMLSVFGSGVLNGLSGAVVVDLRVTVKLLTTTACLVLALRWRGCLP